MDLDDSERVRRTGQIHAILCDRLIAVGEWQSTIRKLFSLWLVSTLFLIVLNLASQLQYFEVSISTGTIILCLGGVLGMLPLAVMDLLHYQLAREAIKRDLRSLEESNPYLLSIQTYMHSRSPRPVVRPVSRIYIAVYVLLFLIAGITSSLHFFPDRWILSFAVFCAYMATLGLGICLFRHFQSLWKGVDFVDFDPVTVEVEDWDQMWGEYRILISYYHYLQEKVLDTRVMTANYVMYLYLLIGVLFSASERLIGVDQHLASGFVSLIGFSIVILLYSVDQVGYKNYINGLTGSLISLEQKHTSLPSTSKNTQKIFKVFKFPLEACVYYIHTVIFLILAGVFFSWCQWVR